MMPKLPPLTRWTAERFGLTPAKLWTRLAGARPGARRVFMNSVPKAGTHLLERALCVHPAFYRKLVPTLHRRNVERWGGVERMVGRLRRGQVLVAHVPHDAALEARLRGTDTASLFMVRDPRDVLVSSAHYITKSAEHRWHAVVGARPDLVAKMRLLLHGDEGIGMPSLRSVLESFAPWLDRSELSVRFEDLIGPRGGGDAARQRASLALVFQTAGVELSGDELARTEELLFSTASPTFRKGQSGGWREHFDPSFEAEFSAAVGDLVERYGYDPASA